MDVEAQRLEAWLDAGRHGGASGAMPWMERHFDKRVDPRELVPGAKSIVSVAHTYLSPAPAPLADDEALARGLGKVSRYAWGDDYHDVLKEKLAELFDWLDTASGGAGGRAFVDSAPVMDKAWAQRAGIGWVGKNTNLLTRSHGSFVFLGELIVDVELTPDDPFSRPLRLLHPLPRRLPHRRAGHPVPDRRHALHLLLDHRAARGRVAARGSGSRAGVRPVDLRLRHLPGRVPLEQVRAGDPRRPFQARGEIAQRPLAEWAELDLEAFRQRLRKSPIKRTQVDGLLRNVENAQANARRWRDDAAG